MQTKYGLYRVNNPSYMVFGHLAVLRVIYMDPNMRKAVVYGLSLLGYDILSRYNQGQQIYLSGETYFIISRVAH